MVRYLFYTIGDLTYQSPLVFKIKRVRERVTGNCEDDTLGSFIRFNLYFKETRQTQTYLGGGD